MRYTSVFLLSLCSLTACSEELDPSPVDPQGFKGVCAVEQTITEHGAQLLRCQELHPSAPALRLPADSPTLRYVAVAPGAGQLITRDGELTISGAQRSLLDAESGSSEGATHGDRYAYTLYAASFDGAGTLTSLKPVIKIDDALLMGHAIAGRSFEGTISPFERIEDNWPRFKIEPTLKVRVEVDAAPARVEDDALHGRQTAVFKARIVNATSRVKGADGQCLPSLKEAGAEDPFPAAAGPREVEFTRVPNMHGGNDDVVVVAWDDASSNMDAGLYVSPARLLRDAPAGVDYSSSPHGTPWNAPHMTLRLVSGGGGACP